MANRFAVPVTQLVNDDASGIGSGFKLNFYTTNTTTRKDTFSDNALSTANANPVVADSSGRFGDIFLGSGTYKVVLTDDNDVEKWTADPVAGSIGATGAVDAKTAAYTITIGDATKTIAVDASSGAITITLPTAASATNGFEVTVKKTDSSANAVTVDGNGAETIDGATTLVLSNQNNSATLRCDGSNWILVATAALPLSFLTTLSTASGTSSETTAIPSGTLGICLVFDGVSTTGTDRLQVEIGSTTYATVSDSTVKRFSTSAVTTATQAGGPGALTVTGAAAHLNSGLVELVKHDDNHWGLVSSIEDEQGDDAWLSIARIELSAAIDRLKITMSGANSFDAGAVHVYTYS